MPRNKFPRRSLVKLLMCDDPACACGRYTAGENGIVQNARGKHIVVRRGDYQGLMTQLVHFRKETAEKHLERLDMPVKNAV